METNIRLNERLIRELGRTLLLPAAEIIAATGMNRSTWYRIVESPRIITVQQLLAVANGLHIPARRFFSTGRTDAVGRREDYIQEPYLPCSYDADTLQSTVYGRPDLSWQQAADAAGITRDNFRNSMLAVTHTPVIRFLDACRVWGIDPFTVLTDPNPEAGERQRRRNETGGGIGEEIAGLRRDMGRLADAVDELTRKYETLLDEHRSLAKRVNVNFENVNGSHISIAATHPDGGK